MQPKDTNNGADGAGAPSVVEWNPIALLSDTDHAQRRPNFALLVLNHPLGGSPWIDWLWENGLSFLAGKAPCLPAVGLTCGSSLARDPLTRFRERRLDSIHSHRRRWGRRPSL